MPAGAHAPGRGMTLCEGLSFLPNWLVAFMQQKEWLSAPTANLALQWKCL